MPYTEDGLIPHIIINPHAVPSRMTLSLLWELKMGKIGAMTGYEYDATPFEDIDEAKLTDEQRMAVIDWAKLVRLKYVLEPKPE